MTATKRYPERELSWMVKIVKLDSGDKEKKITIFPYTDLGHATLDFNYECSIQAKYRAAISGLTNVYLIEIESSTNKTETQSVLKSVEING